MFGIRSARIRRARLVPVAITTAALSSALIGASVTGTLSGFAASITNTNNTAATGSLVMQETTGTPPTQVSCLSSSGTDNNYASCSSINKYGGTASPVTPGGAAHVTTVTIANTGSVAVSTFKLTPAACQLTYLNGTSSSTTSGNLCDSLQLTLTCTKGSGPSQTSGTLYTAASLSSVYSGAAVTIPAACTPDTGGANPVSFAFSIALPSTASSSVQSQQVGQNLTWTFSGA